MGKTYVANKRTVRNYLKSLGSTSREVAKSLEKQGIFGERGSTKYCPIALSLKARYQMRVAVSNNITMSHWDASYARVFSVSHTPATKEFMRRFDKGQYKKVH